MKRLLLLLMLWGMAIGMSAQTKGLTFVYATSGDGFVNVRASRSTKAAIVDKVISMYGGVSQSILISDHGKWVKVKGMNGQTGYCVKKYIDYLTWYTGEGEKRLVAKKPKTTIYVENFGPDESKPTPYVKVKSGTIIADKFSGPENGYYCMQSGHDNLYVKVSDVNVEDNK